MRASRGFKNYRKASLVKKTEQKPTSCKTELKASGKGRKFTGTLRSRIKRMRWGDQNSKFFHASTVQRRDRNRIDRLKDAQGNWVTEENEIRQLIQNHFQSIYSSSSTSYTDECLANIPKVVHEDLNRKLMAKVNPWEIKRAVFDLGDLKAPGPDGLNGLFFQKQWPTIQDTVISAVQLFFEKGEIPKEINETQVALIPKIAQPENISHFLPISCCNFILKVITRIIVTRLKGSMNSLISPNQSAFIGGRQIHDNLIIVEEAFHFLKRNQANGKHNVIIKLDMNKAYDRLEWKFIGRALLAYGFDEAWVGLVMILVRGVTYRYKLNGSTGSELQPRRGLRQGDPLSPYLFILAMDFLSHMLLNAQNSNLLKGVNLARTAPPLTHLSFADDAILFAKAEEGELYQMQKILDQLSKASGQRINTSKSGLLNGKTMDPRKRKTLADILHVEVWDSPGSYLGLPAEWGRSKISSLGWIKDKLLNKIQSWKGRLLNQAGKEILIKAVLQALPTYAMSIIKFPKSFCKDLSTRIANFWWRGDKERGIHWRKWEVITQRKINGGLGFKDLEALNLSLLAKQSWRLLKDNDTLWGRILKSIYFPSSDFTQASYPRQSSWVWSSLLAGRDFLLNNAKWNVGNGEKTDLWKHRWVSSGEVLGDENSNSGEKVKSIIDPVSRKWNTQKILEIGPPINLGKILQNPLSWTNKDDEMVWPFVKNGKYSVKSGYTQAKMLEDPVHLRASTSSSPASNLWKRIWGSKLPRKIQVFLWKLCKNAVAVNDNLKRRNCARSDLCPICHTEPETINHALLRCSWTRAIWFGNQLQLNPASHPHHKFENWFADTLESMKSQREFFNYAVTTLGYTLWEIWKTRNQCVFQGVDPNPVVTNNRISINLQEYLSALPEPPKINLASGGSAARKGWRKPAPSHIKINVDAAFDATTRKGLTGIIFRDSDGEVVHGSTARFMAASPVVAEALALREAVFLAANLGCDRVIFESDCLAVIQACRGEKEVWEIQQIINDIVEMKIVKSYWGFSWVNRCGNKAAHQIAQLAHHKSLQRDWVWHPPPELARQLQRDKVS
ncbi:uncharacterized protein LOC130712164 [Lotus japonicus]|uniref:uncharacterized protein LOC130712164 n=1 Tax=Lotus japonicus TaxID=34305 RepID=UPI002587FED4|nr:uncharacterized protein LOC130712164 [Lotus japonicus]